MLPFHVMALSAKEANELPGLLTSCPLMTQMSTAEQNWSKGRSKIGPLDVMLCEVLRVVPVVHRRDPRCFV